MRALLVGAGTMGKAWARNLRDHGDIWIAGWVDIAPGKAAEAADEHHFHDLWTGTDLHTALRDVKPDFVVDVTIPEAHRDVTNTSLEFGVPVIGEKPMAASMAQAREMVAASERSGKLYMVSQSRRYDARLHAYRRAIDEHTGPLGILNSDFYIAAHFGGFRDEMASPLLLDMAIHTFDAARFLCEGDAVSVYCDEFSPPWSWFKGNGCATAIFRMTDGLRYTYCGSWCSEGLHTSWEAEWRAVGPRGTAKWDGHGAPYVAEVKKTGGFSSEFNEFSTHVVPDMHGGIAGSLRDFLRALQTGETPMGECHDNIKSLAMVYAAIESARTGQQVMVDV